MFFSIRFPKKHLYGGPKRKKQKIASVFIQTQKGSHHFFQPSSLPNLNENDTILNENDSSFVMPVLTG